MVGPKRPEQVLRLRPGDFWLFPESSQPVLFRVETGTVDLLAQNENGMTVILKTAAPGALIPVFSPRSPFLAFGLESPGPSRLVRLDSFLPPEILTELCDLYEKAAAFALLRVSERLRMFFSSDGADSNGHHSVARIAAILGCRRETVSRNLATLNRRRRIRTRKRV